MWLKQNLPGLSVLTAAGGLAVILFLAQGCSLDDFVKADIPREVQTKLGVPARVPLSQARELIADYNQKIEREAKTKTDRIIDFQREAARELAELSDALENRAENLDAELDDFKRTSERVAATLAARVEHANEVAGWLGGLINTGIGAAQASGVGAFPGGSVLLAGLTGLGGLMLRKPGTQKEVDAAYEDGRKAALEAVKEVKSA